jgi:hypothetical protein
MFAKLQSETLTARDDLGDPSVDGMIILNWTLNKQGERVWIGYI